MTNLMNALKKDLKEIYESSIENLHSNTAQKLTDEVIRTEIDSLSSKLREQQSLIAKKDQLIQDLRDPLVAQINNVRKELDARIEEVVAQLNTITDGKK